MTLGHRQHSLKCSAVRLRTQDENRVVTIKTTLTRPSFINFCKERMQIFREAPHTEKPDIPSKHDIYVQLVNKRNTMHFEQTVKRYID